MDRLKRVYEVFPAGPPLTEAQQVGREREISSMVERLCIGEAMLLMEERRTGKTSLEISETHLLRLIEETGGQPYLTMRLARDTARIAVGDPESPRKVDNGQIETALLELRADPVWEQLRGQQP